LDIENDGLLECIGQVCTGSGCNVGSYEITPSGKLEKDDTMIKSKITSIIGYDITDYDGNGFMEPFGYINAGNSNHWIRIRLRGRQSNAFGLGARIKVYNGSHVQTLDVINASIFNFGLAQNTTVDSVVVRWPSRVVDRLCNVSADRLLTVEEGIGDSSIPTEFYFSQNYPNPFNAQTSIRYVIPGEGHSPGKMVDVSIIIYDVLGRRVAVLNDKPQPPGNYLVVWDGKDRTGLPASTGVYLCRIKTGKHIQTKKMLLLR
jgi:hypothetical protein